MSVKAVLFGAVAGLLAQISGGIVMKILWIGGNVGDIFASLIVVALVSAFITGLVAAIMSGRNEIIHGVLAVLVLLLASTINNVFTGNFDPGGLIAGAILAPTAGCFGAGAGVLSRHIDLSRYHQLRVFPNERRSKKIEEDNFASE